MVEKGKRIYVVDKLMPAYIRYTQDRLHEPQLDGCRQNEAFIWNYFVKNGLVYNNDPSLIKNYIGDSPNTPEFGEGCTRIYRPVYRLADCKKVYGEQSIDAA